MEVPPVGRVEGKKEKIESMFDSIAHRYDLVNRLLSLGIDQSWRRKAIAQIKPYKPREILDVATGTADLAILAASLDPERIVGVDISEEMLAFGRKKLIDRNLQDLISLQTGDAEDLPFDNDSFDAALVAFGVRNFENLDAGLGEIRRVIRPGGVLVILEFSRPRLFPMKQAYSVYSKHVMPRVGGMVSGNSGAYTYLPSSVQEFPDGEDFLDYMRKAGFIDTECTRLTTGIASLYRGVA
ncbi:MAG: bifunctional demethylmenaquinone methyltransferase/2-methoxy-6-polyprenyl-1,4-benzoquinol methylase UbiE [Rhodothermales bacterium]|nr:bifunctional demethylmenaquinone methyltransferase/2-methoxy-6-polyprenyl-1,4-benzoquinol methylase UbiE [Rhodothermales bacterium]